MILSEVLTAQSLPCVWSCPYKNTRFQIKLGRRRKRRGSTTPLLDSSGRHRSAPPQRLVPQPGRPAKPVRSQSDPGTLGFRAPRLFACPVAMTSAAGFATRRKPRHAPPATKAATLPYLEAWQAQLASEEAEAQAVTAEVTAKAVTAQGPATVLQQERVEEQARSRWAERMQAHLQGVKATEEVRT